MQLQRKRTILITAPYFWPRVGGLENYAQQIAHGLQNNGWHVVVACGDSVKEVTREHYQGLTIYRLPIWKTISNTPINPKWFFQLRTIIKAEKPVAIITHSPVPFMFDITALAAGSTPVVVTYHAASLDKPGSRIFKLVLALYKPFESMSFIRTAGIIAVSEYVKQALRPKFQTKTTVIPNAVSQVQRPKIALGQGLVFIASLEATHSWKGLEAILEALALCRVNYGIDVALTVVGDGGLSDYYQQRATDLGISQNVYFVGRQIGSKKDAIIRQSLALIAYPTTANDAFPTVLVEAWAQGTTVIVSDIGPMPSLVVNKLTGLVVSANNPAALAERIILLVDHPTTAAKMGEAGRSLTSREYTWPKQVASTIRLIEGLI